ncbi:shikimate dehydrogenase [Candidatus Gracilibacteria bacterium]|nr:shikimate dehydrogenase [Candidatus Gracilibacteria bacterium]
MKRYAVIGYPVEHSKSPQLHEAGFQEFGIDATFEKIEVKPEDLENWLKNDFREHFAGAAVTLPHKIEVRKYIDRESEAARKIGAVNTLINNNGIIEGTNTDGIGALRAIQSAMSVVEKRVLVLGAGGAARAIIFALKTAGAQVAVWNRTPEKAKELAKEFEVGFVERLEDAARVASHLDLFVNTVALNAGTFWPRDFFSEKGKYPSWVAFDASYEPLETPFLLEAEESGAEIITGDKMLVHQAIEQFKLWHGIAPEAEIFGGCVFFMIL